MIRHPGLALGLALFLLPARGRPDDAVAQAGTPLAQPTQESAPPPSEPPAQAPPPAPSQIPPPPAQEGQASGSIPSGHWVYTQQYGWIWMPYAAAYTYAPPDGYGSPYMYVYYPVYGWAWVVAPWVWGWGPWPYFGVVAPWRFAWYGWGWWQYPARWHFRPGPFRGGVAPRVVAVPQRPRALHGSGTAAPVAPGRSGGGRGGGGGHVSGGHVSGGHAPRR